jgi:branched-chain amino acid transport system substrate-binding protein
MNKAIKALCIVIAILLFSGGAAISQEKEPIVVGSIFDQVGFGAELGQGCLRGAQLAVKLVNEAGGIHGHPVKYTNIDAQSDLDLIVSAAMRLTEEMNVVAAAGGEDDSLTNAAGPVFQAHKTVYLTGAVTVPTCTQMGDYIFMVCYGDHFQGSCMLSGTSLETLMPSFL